MDTPLLPASTGTRTTKLLWLHPSGVRDQQRTVVRNQLFLQFHGAVGIDVFGVVCNNGFGDSLTDGIHLRGVSSALDTHSDVERCKGVFSCDENWLVDLEAEYFGLDKVDGRSVDTDEATALLCIRYRGSGLQMTRVKYNCHIVASIVRTFFLPKV